MSSSTKPFVLYTAGTPNGHKISTFLEELKGVYGDVVDYEVQKIELSKNTQKEPWFIALNPNGRIPVLVDRSRNDFTVFESGAILLYLQQHYDTKNAFGWDPKESPDEYSQALQWVFFAHGGIGPMMGQAAHFGRFAPEDIPYAKKRYLDEAKRLFGVLEIGLKDKEWLVGDKFSIADMNAITWVRMFSFIKPDGTLDEWPAVKAWVQRAEARKGFAKGVTIPA